MKKSLTLLICISLLLASCAAPNSADSVNDTLTTAPMPSQETTAPSVPTETSGMDEIIAGTVPDETQSSAATDPTLNGTSPGTDETVETIPPAPTTPTTPEECGQKQTDVKETEPVVTEPPATSPPETTPEETQPPVTEPPVTEPPATETPATEPEETVPPSTSPTEEFKQQVAYYAAYYINHYRVAEKVPGCTILPGMTKVAEYRADQLTYNYSHNTADKRAALAYYEYGRWIDATIVGLDPSESYYEADTTEAICAGFEGKDAESMGKYIADLVHDSENHWTYIGSASNLYIGVGVEYRAGSTYGWYGCIMVGKTNYG